MSGKKIPRGGSGANVSRIIHNARQQDGEWRSDGLGATRIRQTQLNENENENENESVFVYVCV